jgi:hypothetical protein
MDLIHFTRAATDPLSGSASAASFLPLASGHGNTRISCLHLGMRGKIPAPSIPHSAALFCIHGRVSVTTQFPEIQINLHAGMGAIFDPNEPYTLESDAGAILLIVESPELTACNRAISTPQRIAGSVWPGDSVAG